MKVRLGNLPSAEDLDDLATELQELHGYARKGVKNKGIRLEQNQVYEKVVAAIDSGLSVYSNEIAN